MEVEIRFWWWANMHNTSASCWLVRTNAAEFSPATRLCCALGPLLSSGIATCRGVTSWPTGGQDQRSKVAIFVRVHTQHTSD